ncbi:MAG: FtsX-like permease family protein [Pseudomonadales bacterium]|nr:FtsX-like permease family protein [Pseudomonadales bacterium]
MEIGPILRAMLRHKTGAILIAVQIAFTMTVVVNALFLVEDRLDRMDRPSGLVEDELFQIVSTGFVKDFNTKLAVEQDLDTLRKTPGIADAIQINAIPLSDSGWSTGLKVEPGEDEQDFSAAAYMVDEHGIDTMGVKLIAGENFNERDVQWRDRSDSGWPPKAIITKALANAMYPDLGADQVVGKTAYVNDDKPIRIVGVIERLQAPWNGWSRVEQSMLVPQQLNFSSALYLIRTEPGQRDAMMPIVEELLVKSNPDRLIRSNRSMAEIRRQSYQVDRAISIMLVVTMTMLIAITAFGIVGLASFSVRGRTRQIGTRRALGATRQDILRYFMVENFLITTMGVVAGGVMTIAFNMWLVEAMSFPKIDWLYVPFGMIILWLIGQGAVLGPALRAANIPPALATRTV